MHNQIMQLQYNYKNNLFRNLRTSCFLFLSKSTPLVVVLVCFLIQYFHYFPDVALSFSSQNTNKISVRLGYG